MFTHKNKDLVPNVIIEWNEKKQGYSHTEPMPGCCGDCFHSLFELSKSELVIHKICSLGGFPVFAVGSCKEFTKEIPKGENNISRYRWRFKQSRKPK